MTIAALDRSSALVICDLQNALVNAPTAPFPGTEVVARAVELARATRRDFLGGTTLQPRILGCCRRSAASRTRTPKDGFADQPCATFPGPCERPRRWYP